MQSSHFRCKMRKMSSLSFFFFFSALTIFIFVCMPTRLTQSSDILMTPLHRIVSFCSLFITTRYFTSDLIKLLSHSAFSSFCVESSKWITDSKYLLNAMPPTIIDNKVYSPISHIICFTINDIIFRSWSIVWWPRRR